MRVEKRVLDASESKIFRMKIEGTGFSDRISDHSNLKILTLKQMLQGLPKGLAQVKEDNTWNEIKQNHIFFVSSKINDLKSII